jgi:biotin operon repressor
MDYNAQNNCRNCGKVLTRDEKAIYYRLVNRGAKDFLCIPCLADYFKCSVKDIENRIVSLKKMGCTLFCQADIKEEYKG